MEKKVARGQGERSNEGGRKLQSQIEALETELDSKKQKKLLEFSRTENSLDVDFSLLSTKTPTVGENISVRRRRSIKQQN